MWLPTKSGVAAAGNSPAGEYRFDSLEWDKDIEAALAKIYTC